MRRGRASCLFLRLSLAFFVTATGWRALGCSAKGERSEIDCDQQRLGDLVHRLVVGIDPPRGWHLDALKIPVVRRVVRTGGATQNIDRIVMSPHQAVWPEMRNLGLAVAGDVVGEGDFQASPYLAVLVPRRDLLTLETRIGVEEGRGEIGPQRLAGEVGDMELVPGRFERLAGKARRSETGLDRLFPGGRLAGDRPDALVRARPEARRELFR